jgi:hypothetical protein
VHSRERSLACRLAPVGPDDLSRLAARESIAALASVWYTGAIDRLAGLKHAPRWLAAAAIVLAMPATTQAKAAVFAPAPLAGTWSAASPMTMARGAHVAVLLASGHVLVAGGGGANGVLRSAELFDPTSGTWSRTGDMTAARLQFSASLLLDERVLVAGGWSGSAGALSSAELFDPLTGTWSPTGSMLSPRNFHATTLLADGRVLVVGGGNGGGPVAAPEIFDPVGGTWSRTAPMTNPTRVAPTATVLNDGRVLVAGGSDVGGVSPASAEIYDPVADTWTPVANMNGRRAFHGSFALPNGRALVVGGRDAFGCDASAEIFDPSSGAWSVAPSMATPRNLYFASPVVLLDSTALVTGNRCATGMPSSELFDPVTETWANAGSMLFGGRDAHTATLLLDGRVLVAAGRTRGSSSSPSRRSSPQVLP